MYYSNRSVISSLKSKYIIRFFVVLMVYFSIGCTTAPPPSPSSPERSKITSYLNDRNNSNCGLLQIEFKWDLSCTYKVFIDGHEVQGKRSRNFGTYSFETWLPEGTYQLCVKPKSRWLFLVPIGFDDCHIFRKVEISCGRLTSIRNNSYVKNLPLPGSFASNKHSIIRDHSRKDEPTGTIPHLSGKNDRRGYVVGRIYLKVDGFQGHHGDAIHEAKVEIAHVKNDLTEEIEIIEAKTDKNGYFVLDDQPMAGRYYPIKLHTPAINVPVNSVVPPPDPSDRISLQIVGTFSSRREGSQPIIDCGETVLVIKASGKLAVERSYDKVRSIIDYTKDSPIDIVEGTYGYPGLDHFAKSGWGRLRSTAQAALQERRAFARAEPLKEEGDELQKSDKNAAMSKYREAVRVYPAYEDAYGSLVSVLIEERKKNDAIQVLEDAVRNCPSSDDLRFELAKIYVSTGKPEKSVTLLEPLLQKKQDDVLVYENLAKAYQAAGRERDADSLWQRALNSVKGASRFREAGHFYKQIGQTDKAIPLYEQYLTAKPKDRSAFVYLADAYLAAGRGDDGGQLWERGLRELKDDDKYYNAGQFYRKAGEPDKAIPCYESYLSLEPSNPERYDYLANAFLAADRYEDGKALWQRGLKEIMDDEKYRYAGNFFRRAKKPAIALTLFHKYNEAKPDDNWAKIYLLRSYVANGKIPDAVQTALRGNKAIIYLNAYSALMASYQFNEAEDMLRKALHAYFDGTLSMERNSLEDRIANLSIEKKTRRYFVSYLKAIQDDSDYDNWRGKPYDLYIERNPLAK